MISNDEFSKCRFCSYYDFFEGCEFVCENKSSFKPNNNRIIETAKEKGISVSDLIELIEMNEKYGGDYS